MSVLQWIGLVIAALAGAWTSLHYQNKTGPFKPVPEPVTTPPEEPVVAPEPVNAVLLWDTPKQAYHSTRVLCDEILGLPAGIVLMNGTVHLPKDIICACIYQESRFSTKAVGKQNTDGTRDYGICQFNDGKNKNGVPYWIGTGALFSSIHDVFDNPERAVRTMIGIYRQTKELRPWSSYVTGAYYQWLSPTSPMWLLKEVY